MLFRFVGRFETIASARLLAHCPIRRRDTSMLTSLSCHDILDRWSNVAHLPVHRCLSLADM
jgi:hypothetical protein